MLGGDNKAIDNDGTADNNVFDASGVSDDDAVSLPMNTVLVKKLFDVSEMSKE